MAEAAAAATTADTTTTTTPAGTPWYQGKVTDAEIIGHIQNKGWHDKDPTTVAIEAATAHRQAEKHIGVPANQLIRLPANLNDGEAMKPVWQRLGAPADAKDYDFSAVKKSDGSALAEKFVDTMRQTAAALSLPKDSAPRVAEAVVKYLESEEAAAKAEKSAFYDTENAKLAKSWGANSEANLFIAKGAMNAVMKAAGLDETQMRAGLEGLEGAVGKANAMQMFLAIGQKIGEDKFVASEGGRPGVMTREQAIAKRADLKTDNAWVKRYMDGGRGSPEFREMMALNTLIDGDDTDSSRRR